MYPQPSRTAPIVFVTLGILVAGAWLYLTDRHLAEGISASRTTADWLMLAGGVVVLVVGLSMAQQIGASAIALFVGLLKVGVLVAIVLGVAALVRRDAPAAGGDWRSAMDAMSEAARSSLEDLRPRPEEVDVPTRSAGKAAGDDAATPSEPLYEPRNVDWWRAP